MRDSLIVEVSQNYPCIRVKLFVDAGEQIMSNLGLLLETVFCEDMKVYAEYKNFIHIFFVNFIVS